MAAEVRRIQYPFYALYVWYAVLGLLVLLGLYSFYREYFEGHYITGLTNVTPWGLYIAGFVFFVGTSAGATVIGLMIHAFGREDYRPLGTRAILVGLLSLAAAVTFIMVHVGSIPKAMLVPWIWRNPTAMFTYTSLSYYVFGLILLAELYYAVRLRQGSATSRDRAVAKWLAIIAVPWALAVLHAFTGSLFAVVKAREFWNSPLLPPHFAIVALVSGTSLMILVAAVTAWLNGRELVGKAALAHMGALLAFFIAVTGFLDFFDLLVFTYSDVVTGGETRHFLTTTHLPFSVVQVVGYGAAFVILLFPKGRTMPWVAVAAVAALIAAAAYRYNLTTVGMEIQLFPFQEHVHYFPTWTEVSLSLGIVALMLLAYSVLVRVLPMEEPVGSP